VYCVHFISFKLVHLLSFRGYDASVGAWWRLAVVFYLDMSFLHLKNSVAIAIMLI